MAVVGNILTEIGDVITFKCDTPVIGVIDMQSFTEDVSGVTSTRYFNKSFSYTFDGINYSSWEEINTSNVDAMTVSSMIPLKIEFIYERAGTDTSGQLIFNSVSFIGEFIEIPVPEIFKKSVFFEFFNWDDPDHIDWAINVLTKTYKEGIVPKYIIRNENGNINGEDQDYLNLFMSSCWYYSLFVRYIREFDKWSSNTRLLVEFLNNRGMHVCSDSTLADMVYVINNYYDEIRRRGTLPVFVRGGDALGEFLRTICYKEIDEFLFTFTRNYVSGWVVDRSSPVYRGVYFDKMLNKWYEDTEDFVDLNKYILTGSSFIDIISDTSPIDGVTEIDALRVQDPTVRSGLGMDDRFIIPDLDKLLVVNSLLSYEITFWIKVSDISKVVIDIGVLAYDVDRSHVFNKRISNGDLKIDTSFISSGFWSGQKNDTWVLVRAILYGANVDNIPSFEDYCLNIMIGENIKFNGEDIKYILPYVIVVPTGVAPIDVRIWDMKVRPLMKPYGTGFLRPQNLIQIWAYNRNDSFIKTITDIFGEHPITGDNLVEYKLLYDFVRDKLISYNSTLVINWLNK
jgi:hypothetical protein